MQNLRFRYAQSREDDKNSSLFFSFVQKRRRVQKGTVTFMKTKELFAGRTKSDIKLILKSAGAALLSFLFGAAQLFGTISPFGTAVVSGLPVQYAVAGSVGAIVGSILFLPSGRTF